MADYIVDKNSLITRFVKIFDPLVALPKWKKFRSEIERLDVDADDFFFIQIGSNDGVIHDPLYHYIIQYQWAGILVEPVSFYFDQLKANYQSNQRLRFENLAISDKPEIRDFYRVKDGLDQLPSWSKGLGSFFPDVILKHQWAIPDIKHYLVKDRVRCIPFQQLIDRHRVAKVDLLMIDTEGFDYEIIKQLDFQHIKPQIIIYEHKHLAKRKRAECERLLSRHRYALFNHFSNTLAVLKIN